MFALVLVSVTCCCGEVAFGAIAKCSAIGVATSNWFALTYIFTGIVTGLFGSASVGARV